MQYRAIPESYGDHSNKLWCYDVCYNPTEDGESEWTPVYCFTETEFLPQDYEMMSWFTSTHRNSFFTKYMTSTKMIMDEAQEKIIGNLTLFEDTVRETIGSEKKVVQEFKTEEERLGALKELYGIEISDEEREGLPAAQRLS